MEKPTSINSANSNTGNTKQLVNEAKSLISDSKSAIETSIEETQQSVADKFSDAKHKWLDLENTLVAKGQQVKLAGSDLILQSPLKAVILASAAGLLIGWLFSRMRD